MENIEKYHCQYCFTVFKKSGTNHKKIFCSDSCRKLQNKLSKGKPANPYSPPTQKIIDEYMDILNKRIAFEKTRNTYGNTAVEFCLEYLKLGHYKKINAYKDYLLGFPT